MFLFSIYDRVAGVYGAPFVLANESLAKRYFPYIVKENPTYNRFPNDMDLFSLGEYDENTGVITSASPKFIMHFTEEGEKNE